MPIKIIIADDHHLILEGFNVMLGKIPDIEIIAEASNGEQLLRLTRNLHPDVVVTDIKMPVLDGIAVTKAIKTEFPYIGVVALSSYDEGQLLLDMVKAGAKCLLLKTAPPAEIVQAIKKAAQGESFYCNSRDKLSELVAKSGNKTLTGAKDSFFTSREIEIVELVCTGLSSKQIADRLRLKTRTIESYREKIMMKMEVPNSAGLAIYAVTHGLFKSTP